MQISVYAIPGIKERKVICKDDVFEKISRLVCYHMKIPFEYIFDKSRKREHVLSRQIAMYIIKKNYPQFSLKSVGFYFGGRDHTTVIYSVDTLKNLMWSDKLLKSNVENIESFV